MRETFLLVERAASAYAQAGGLGGCAWQLDKLSVSDEGQGRLSRKTRDQQKSPASILS
jgi:hypothetical protein